LFRRPDATRRLLESLDRCYGVDECAVYLSVDYDPAHHAGCAPVVDIADDWVKARNRRIGHDVITLWGANNPRLGIDLHKLKAIPDALTWSGADRFIFLEDDTSLSPDCLNFFATTLAETEADPSVLAVCGYNRVPDDHKGVENIEAARALAHFEPYGNYRCNGFKPWGWAMNKAQWDRWFGDDNGARYIREAGDQANGQFDHWLSRQCKPVSEGGAGMVTVRPYLARTGHAEWDLAEHTPSREHWEQHERVTVMASMYDIPDTGLLGWGKP
jgi:hypothetical protein